MRKPLLQWIKGDDLGTSWVVEYPTGQTGISPILRIQFVNNEAYTQGSWLGYILNSYAIHLGSAPLMGLDPTEMQLTMEEQLVKTVKILTEHVDVTGLYRFSEAGQNKYDEVNP